MLSPFEQRLLRCMCKIYGVMLLVYPCSFRRGYSREMMLVFRNGARDVVQNSGSWALLPFSLHILCDWLMTVLFERDDMEIMRKALVAAVRDTCCITVAVSCFVVVAYMLFGRDDNALKLLFLRFAFEQMPVSVFVAQGTVTLLAVSGAVSAVGVDMVAVLGGLGLMWLSGSMVMRPVSYYAFDVGAVGVLQSALTVPLFSWRQNRRGL